MNMPPSNDLPHLDFLDYRCALAAKKLWEPEMDIASLEMPDASAEQKDRIFGISHVTDSLFTAGINNIQFGLFHDIRSDQFILGFRSTKTLPDFIDNIQQLFGKETELYNQAKELVKRIRPEFCNKIILTGHSLGGGLAAVAALSSGCRAVIFNPPKIHRNTITGLKYDDSRIVRYRVKGDIVSKIGWSENHIELGRETKLSVIPFADSHSLNQVISGLKEEFAFTVFLIDSIVEVLHQRTVFDPKELRRHVFNMVHDNALPSGVLPNLLSVEYQVEDTKPSAQITVTVIYQKDRTSAEKIEQKSDWKWEDLPEEFRADFIKNRISQLHYSIYKKGNQNGSAGA